MKSIEMLQYATDLVNKYGCKTQEDFAEAFEKHTASNNLSAALSQAAKMPQITTYDPSQGFIQKEDKIEELRKNFKALGVLPR